MPQQHCSRSSFNSKSVRGQTHLNTRNTTIFIINQQSITFFIKKVKGFEGYNKNSIKNIQYYDKNEMQKICNNLNDIFE